MISERRHAAIPTVGSAGERLPRTLIAPLALAMLLNDADRDSLSIAAPALKDAFAIDNATNHERVGGPVWPADLSLR